MNTVFMLPGQGSLYPGMLQELYAHRETHWPEWSWGEKVLARYGIDAANIWFEASRSTQVDRPTQESHPATFAVQYCLGKLLERTLGKPTAYMGYSLGEITALALAGTIDPEQTVDTLVKVGEACDRHNSNGGMLAIVDDLSIRDSYFPLFEETEVGCYNYEGHHVIAGLTNRLDRICQLLKSESIIHERLAVPCPFHSSYMSDSEQALKRFSLHPQAPEHHAPVYSCLLSKSYESKDFQKDHIWQLHRGAVQFQDTIKQIDRELCPTYIDISSTGTLGTFTKQLHQGNTDRVIQTFSPWGKDLKQLERIVSQLQ